MLNKYHTLKTLPGRAFQNHMFPCKQTTQHTC